MPVTSHMSRVLLVEDNSTHQRFARIVLEKAGGAVDVAQNGREALLALAERDYALVLMDCLMPVMSGVEAARQIRAGSAGVRNPNIPIVGISANAFRDNQCQCLAAGMNDWISKPVTALALLEIVERWLLRRGSIRAVGSQSGCSSNSLP